MVTVSFVYFIFLYIDIRLHVLNVKKALKDRERRQQIFEQNLAKLKVSVYHSFFPWETPKRRINRQFVLSYRKNSKDPSN